MAKQWRPRGVIKSKTLPIEIATNDYWEASDDSDPAVVRGKKRYFTYDEAVTIKADGGWRLPTRAEWMGLCAEFGEEDGDIDASVLRRALKLRMGGFVRSGSLRVAGFNGYYWSSTAGSSTSNPYALYFYSGYASPSVRNDRYHGFSVRLVRGYKGVKMADNNNKRKAIKDMTVQELIDSCMGLWR